MNNSKHRGLGKGIEALIEDSSASFTSEKIGLAGNVLFIDINKITPNVNQPRKNFDEEKLQELADSIKTHGLIQPIVVKPIDSGYEIVVGERRWRASRKAGLRELPCLVKDMSEQNHLLLALIENIQRENLSALEEAMAFDHMIRALLMTQDEISQNVAKSRPYIANSLRLLRLPDEIKVLLSEGKLSAGHARALLTIDDKDKQIALAKEVVEKDLSVRQIEALVSGGAQHKSKIAAVKKSIELSSIESEIKDALGAKINIKQSKNNKGCIEIKFFSKDELERLIELLLAARN